MDKREFFRGIYKCRKAIYINVLFLSAFLFVFYIFPLCLGIFAVPLYKHVGGDYCEFVSSVPMWYTNRILLLNLKSDFVAPRSKTILFCSVTSSLPFEKKEDVQNSLIPHFLEENNEEMLIDFYFQGLLFEYFIINDNTAEKFFLIFKENHKRIHGEGFYALWLLDYFYHDKTKATVLVEIVKNSAYFKKMGSKFPFRISSDNTNEWNSYVRIYGEIFHSHKSLNSENMIQAKREWIRKNDKKENHSETLTNGKTKISGAK